MSKRDSKLAKLKLLIEGNLLGVFYFFLLIVLTACGDSGSETNTAEEPKADEYFTDTRDSQMYKIVTIGSQVWFAKNLNFRTSSGSSYYNNDSSTYAATYGRLYKWQVAAEAVPEGWHLPTDAEWSELIEYLGGSTVAGGKLKVSGTSLWLSPNTGATNSSGFAALPGGYADPLGSYSYMGSYGGWWSSTESSVANAFKREMYYNQGGVARNAAGKNNGYSVRCVKNQP